MTHIHASLLHSTDDAAVAAFIDRLAVKRPRSISTTESTGFRAVVSAGGYVTVHPRGPDGEGESAILVRQDEFLRALPAWQLSDLPIPRRSGAKAYATPADTRSDGRILAVHMPSGVEDRTGFKANAQTRVYRDAIGGLRRYVATHPQVNEIHGDWNLDPRLPWVVEYFEHHFPAFDIVAPKTATHAGGRVIDWALVRRGHRAYTAAAHPNPVSDHETVVFTPLEIPMANRYPAASFEPLGRQTESRMTSHDIICIHTMVGSLSGTDSMFERDGFSGTESHFGTGGAGEKVKQWQDLAFSADANLDGWHRVISIENADMGPGFPAWSGSNVPGFTDKQLDQLVDLVAWLCSKAAHSACPSSWKCHQVGIPAVLIPDSKLGRRGIGYHRQGVDGSLPDMRVAGGELWSSSDGKICPGDRRVAQTRNQLVPRVAARLAPARTKPASPKWDAIWELANELVQAAPDDADRLLDDRDDVARQIRTLAARYSTKH